MTEGRASPRWSSLLLAGAAGACAQSATSTGLPARLVAPDADCRTEIAAFIAAHTGAAVTLAPKIFLASDRLEIERVVRRDAQGRPLDGRRLDRPRVFVLRKDTGGCALIEEATGAHSKLANCTCATATE